MSTLIGQQVALRGKFSLRGKVGPFVLVNGGPVYLIAKDSFNYGQHSKLEGKLVAVTGIILFYRPPTTSETAPDSAVARLPDYFYFDAESAKVHLVEK